MLEQELKPEPRPRRTLRETERRRVMRSRFLGVGIILTLGIAATAAVKHALPQWIAMPGNVVAAPETTQPIPFTAAKRGAFPAATLLPVNKPKVRVLHAASGKFIPNINAARRPAVVSNGLGPEILPVEKTEAPRRHKRRHRSTQQVTALSPTPAAPTKHAGATIPSAKLPEPPPAELHSKPPDDVPDNP